MNKNSDDKIIYDMYNKIDTPDYDVSKEVLEKISPKYHSKVVLKRILIVSIIICLCVVALGAARLLGWQNFNLYGEKTGSGSPIGPAITPVPGHEDDSLIPIHETPPYENPEIIEYNNQFSLEHADDEVRIIMIDHGNGGYGSGSDSGIRTDDFSTITDIMRINKSPLKLPSYIPEGYSFARGNVDFYIDEDSPPELIFTEEKYGHVYFIYKLQEGYKENIYFLKTTYTNKKGNRIDCFSIITSTTVDNTEYQASEIAVTKSIEISTFDYGIWIYDKQKTYNLNTIILHKKIPQIDSIDLSNSVLTSIHLKNSSVQEMEFENMMLISVDCIISSDTLDVEELIKVAESIN
ncbi:MAG: hypothetical protein KAQ68_07760 [Clostridiales bacterium]|nr:hypothetical protein [Clostridiales bacterium]